MKPITGHGLDDVLAWRPSGPVRVREFLADTLSVAALLPAGSGVLNLCEDRYHFAVLFAACLLTGKASLQPSSHSAETLYRLGAGTSRLFRRGRRAVRRGGAAEPAVSGSRLSFAAERISDTPTVVSVDPTRLCAFDQDPRDDTCD